MQCHNTSQSGVFKGKEIAHRHGKNNLTIILNKYYKYSNYNKEEYL